MNGLVKNLIIVFYVVLFVSFIVSLVLGIANFLIWLTNVGYFIGFILQESLNYAKCKNNGKILFF
jgi:hypothetical protein